MVTFKDVSKHEVLLLIERGYALHEPMTKYEEARLKGPCTVVLFKSKKLLIQGNDDSVEELRKLLVSLGFKEVKKPDFAKQEGVFIGSDETLKGDTFGGLVVVGVKANNIERENLIMLGVMDSKKFRDERIPDMAEQIKKLVTFSIKSVYPEDYNHYSLTPLLNRLHKEVAKNLVKNGESYTHVVDKYPGCTTGDIITIKAESKYIEVAAASIIARHEALKQFMKLSDKLRYPVPKGSTHVKEALEFLKKSDKDPKQFVKMHFSNVKAILE